MGCAMNTHLSDPGEPEDEVTHNRHAEADSLGATRGNRAVSARIEAVHSAGRGDRTRTPEGTRS